MNTISRTLFMFFFIILPAVILTFESSPENSAVRNLLGGGSRRCITTTSACDVDAKNCSSVTGGDNRGCEEIIVVSYTKCTMINDDNFTCNETYSNTNPARCATKRTGRQNGGGCAGVCTSDGVGAGQLIPNSTSGDPCPPSPDPTGSTNN